MSLLGCYAIFCTKHLICKENKQCLPTVQHSKKMYNIEFLRIIFTITVLCYHLSQTLKLWNCVLSVEFFFILSGYFLVCTFNPQKDIFTFIKQRVIRFLPLIVFASLVRGLFASKINVNNMLSDFLFLPVPGLNNGIGLVNVAWYISILFWVSLFFFYLLKNYKTETVNLLIGVITFFSYTLLVSNGHWSARAVINDLLHVNLLRGLGAMGLGYFLARYMQNFPTQISKNKVFYTFLEIFTLSYGVLTLFIKSIHLSNSLYTILLYVLLIYLFINKKGYVSIFFDKPIWGKLSKYCLSIYLVQGVVVYDILKISMKYYSDFIYAHKIITMIVFVVLSFVWGIFAHYYIEKNFLKFLKNNNNKEINN